MYQRNGKQQYTEGNSGHHEMRSEQVKSLLPGTQQSLTTPDQRDDRLVPVVFLVVPFLEVVDFLVTSFMAVAVFFGAAFFSAARSGLTAGGA